MVNETFERGAAATANGTEVIFSIRLSISYWLSGNGGTF